MFVKVKVKFKKEKQANHRYFAITEHCTRERMAI